MQAIVTESCWGAHDGQHHPVKLKIGDIVKGNLANELVLAGKAKQQELEAKALGGAPANKSFPDRSERAKPSGGRPKIRTGKNRVSGGKR